MSYNRMTLGMIAVVALTCVCLQAPIDAQGKKDDLAKQVQQLQKALKDRDQTIQKLRLDGARDDGKIVQLQQRIKQLEAELKGKKTGTGNKTAAQYKKELDAANQSIKEKDQLIATLQDKAPTATANLSKEIEKLRKTVRGLETAKKALFAHTLILKLKKDDDAQVKSVYEEAGKTLAKIAGVRSILVGKPVENPTPELAQKGYQLGIVILLDDSDALTKFLDDPLHKRFNDKMANAWEPPVVYDFQREIAEPKKTDKK